jgi:hypothetical protein
MKTLQMAIEFAVDGDEDGIMHQASAIARSCSGSVLFVALLRDDCGETKLSPFKF